MPCKDMSIPKLNMAVVHQQLKVRNDQAAAQGKGQPPPESSGTSFDDESEK